MQITVHPDLAAYLQDVIDVNAFDPQKYVNGIIEKGIKADLAETYDPDSIRAFWLNLIINKKADWTLLETDTLFCDICNKACSFKAGESETCSKCGRTVCQEHCRFPNESPICTECVNEKSDTDKG